MMEQDFMLPDDLPKHPWLWLLALITILIVAGALFALLLHVSPKAGSSPCGAEVLVKQAGYEVEI